MRVNGEVTGRIGEEEEAYQTHTEQLHGEI